MPRYKRYGYTISVVSKVYLEASAQALVDPSVVGFELNEKKAHELVDKLLASSITPGKGMEIVADTSYDYIDQTPGDTIRTVLIEYPGGRSRSQIILQRWFVWVGKE